MIDFENVPDWQDLTPLQRESALFALYWWLDRFGQVSAQSSLWGLALQHDLNEQGKDALQAAIKLLRAPPTPAGAEVNRDLAEKLRAARAANRILRESLKAVAEYVKVPDAGDGEG